MRISEIIKREDYLLCEISDELEFNQIKTDIYNLDKCDVLFILSDEKAPDFSQIKAAPLAVVCSAKIILPDFMSAIRVDNPRRAWANACFRYENFLIGSTKIIAVTGTNGKSTTASLIRHILASLGHKVGFIGTDLYYNPEDR